MRRVAICLWLALCLLGCGDEDEEGGSVRITNEASHELRHVKWYLYLIEGSPDLDIGESGRVEIDGGLTVFGQEQPVTFFVGSTEYRTLQTYTASRGETIQALINDDTTVIECLLDTDPACVPVP